MFKNVKILLRIKMIIFKFILVRLKVRCSNFYFKCQTGKIRKKIL